MSSHLRPLSPHIQIYRWQITSVLSISHRITGLILSSGFLYLTALLTSLLYGHQSYEKFYTFSQFQISQVYLFILCYSFYYHLCNGIRHLCWDMGYGFEMPQVRLSGWITVVTSLVLTITTWFLI